MSEYVVAADDKMQLKGRIEKALTPGRWVAYQDANFVFVNEDDFPVPKSFESKEAGIAWLKSKVESLGYHADANRAYHYRIYALGDQTIILEAMTAPSIGRGMRRWYLRYLTEEAREMHAEACMLKAVPKLQFYRWLDTI